MNPKLFIGLLAIAALSACGSQTNPTTDYQDLNDSVPLHNQKVDPQGVMPADVFDVQIPANMNFVEGQDASYPITISSRLKDITFNLVATGLPNGIQLVKVNEANYLIKGHVAVGSSAGIPTGEITPITIQAVNPKGDTQQVRMFSGLLHEWGTDGKLTITVYPTNQKPMVEAQNLGGLTVNEGDSLPISVVVSDIGSHGSQVPEVQIPVLEDFNQGEISFVSGIPGLRMKRTPKSLGHNRYQFDGTLNTKKLDLPDGKKDITARIVLKFKSPSGLDSAEEIIDVKIIRSQPAPAPAPAPALAPAPVAAAPAATDAPATTTPAPVAVVKPKPTPKPAAKKPATKKPAKKK